jgi:hypothetical protein
MEKMLTYTEAAAFAGVSFKTIHKHVKQGKLNSVQTPLGKRIPEEALLPYRNLKRTDGNEPEQASLTGQEPTSPFETVSPPSLSLDRNEWEAGTEQGQTVRSVPLEAHLAALELAKTQLDRAYVQMEEERQRAEESRQLAERAERSKLVLEWQIQQYQGVLGESAESLAEERALRQQAEARLQEKETLPLENLKVATSSRKGWGHRLRGWLGLKEAQG